MEISRIQKSKTRDATKIKTYSWLEEK